MKRVLVKNKIDHKFFCPYCNCDLRKEGINYTEYRIEYVSHDKTAYYGENGELSDDEYNDSETTDSEGNGYGDYYYCGGCNEELEVNSDIINKLDVSELWDKNPE